MLNADLKSTAVMLITKKNIILLFLGNRNSHNFIIHIDKHNYYVL